MKKVYFTGTFTMNWEQGPWFYINDLYKKSVMTPFIESKNWRKMRGGAKQCVCTHKSRSTADHAESRPKLPVYVNMKYQFKAVFPGASAWCGVCWVCLVYVCLE